MEFTGLFCFLRSLIMRLKLTISYDGSSFQGWQSQPSRNTIQDHLEAALFRITSQAISVHGSGRTDAGVHALAQTAHFDVPATARLSLMNWQNALNANLPFTIRILRIQKVADTFHARFSAQAKIYRYQIITSCVMPPLDLPRAWHVPQKIDLDLLKDQIPCFIGTHDFRAFSAKRHKAPEDTIRTISSIRLRKAGSRLTFTFQGNGFLYKMVRMIMGGLIHVAQKRAAEDWIVQLLNSPGTASCTHVAPAHGLTLMRVLY